MPPVPTSQSTPAYFNSHRLVSPSGRKNDHVHIDLVGPLPPCQGFTYVLTCVDYFMCWPEVVPLTDITATSVAHAFLTGWIACFGVPTSITTDRGSQLAPYLWQKLLPPRLNMDTYHGLPPRSQWTC